MDATEDLARKHQLVIDEAFLVIIAEILIRRFGTGNTLVIEDFRKDLVGAPMHFGLVAGIVGSAIVLQLEPIGERTITPEDLAHIKEGQVH